MDFEEDDNIDIHKQFKQVLVFDEAESKYRVQLPFKDNFTGCQLYFKSLTRKLEKDEDLLLKSGVTEHPVAEGWKNCKNIPWLKFLEMIYLDITDSKLRHCFYGYICGYDDVVISGYTKSQISLMIGQPSITLGLVYARNLKFGMEVAHKNNAE